MEYNSLTNQFLIAMPGLEDPNFSRSLSYICEHSDDGAMGIVVNRPTDLVLGDIFEQLSLSAVEESILKKRVFQGGPVQSERGFILHSDDSVWDSTLAVDHGLNITTSKDILEAIACGQGPDECLMALGYAGWGSGQLENEISENVWLSGPADYSIIFNTPTDQRLSAAAKTVGVDINLISSQIGHA